MITTAILIMIYVIVNLLVTPLMFLPSVSLESSFSVALAGLGHYLSNLIDIFPPLSTVFSILLLIFAVELGVAVYKIIMWVIRRIPTQS